MRPECIAATARAIGRALTAQESTGIEERVRRAMRQAARADQAAWQSKSMADRLTEAGELAGQELLGEGALKKQRLALQSAAISRVGASVNDMRARGIGGLDALDRTVAFHADGKSNVLSIESQAKAIERDSLRQMLGTLTASNPKWFGLFENEEGVRNIVREIFGESSGVTEAAQGAKEWANVTTALRERFNRAGGDVGTLEDWGLPHHHSQSSVARAGREQWVADTLPLIDRDRYFNEDGSRMNDAQLSEFLGHAWVSIATGGANKLTPGGPRGSGMRANRGSESRQVHFKDADSYLAYQGEYGERSLYEVLVGHVSGVSKDIALVETFGPNPDHAFRYWRDSLVQEGKLADPTQTGKLDERAVRSESLYNEVAGKTLPVASERIAATFDTLRNWLVASRLGSAVITSFSDDATLHLTGQLNNLPAMKLIANELAAFNPVNRVEERLALRAGLAMNTLISSLNRFGQGGLGAAFSKRLASTVLRVSGLNAMTEARKRAFGVTMMSSLGSVTREHGTLAALDPHDNRILLSKGITETDWSVWRAAQLEDWGGGNNTMLTPEAIYRTPDAEIDKVITPAVDHLKLNAQRQIDELSTKDVQDQQWLSSRASKFNQWLSDAKTSVSRRLAEHAEQIDKKSRETAERVEGRISKLQEKLELSSGLWEAPQQDTPGIDSSEQISFYGKNKLRSMGKQEGAAAEQLKNIEGDLREIMRDAQSLKSSRMKLELDELNDRFEDRRADLAGFADRVAERAQRRQQVSDRIAQDIEPSIAAERAKAREQAATRLLGIVLEEADVAVIEPGAKERVITGAHLQRGSWKGELTRSFFLFKSFPLAMIARHWARGMSLPNTGGRAAYLATLFAATTVAGMVSLQVSEMLKGRDPRNLNPAGKGGVRNWVAAMLKGGSLGIYGDFLFSDATQYGQSPFATISGPVLGTVEDAFNLTQGNIMQTVQGKDAHAGAEFVKFAKGNTPGASLWYAKAALDHLVWNQLAEYFSPGYLAKMRRRAQKDFQQSYWWEPQDAVPDRAPDLEKAVQ